MSLRTVRNDHDIERTWIGLQVRDDDRDLSHTLRLEPGGSAEVDLPSDFCDPHLSEIDGDGNVVPWPDPHPVIRGELTEGGGGADLPTSGARTLAGINPVHQEASATVPSSSEQRPATPPEDPPADKSSET